MGIVQTPSPDDASGIEKADVAVAQAAGEVRDTRAAKVVAAIGEVGDQPPMVAISAVTLAAGLYLRDDRLARTGLRMLAAHALATGVKAVVKQFVARTRPSKMLDEDHYEVRANGPTTPEWNSFPSGHTAGAVAVGRAVAREYPGGSAAAYGAMGFIALAQIPRCAHYPSDIAAGAVIGWVSELAVDRVLDLASGSAKSAAQWQQHRDAMRRVQASRQFGS